MWERNVKRIRMKNPVGAGFLSSFVRSGVLSSLCHAVPSSLRSSRMEGDVRRLTTVTYGEARDGNDQGNSRFAHPRSCVTSSPLHLFRLSEPEALRAGGEGVGEEVGSNWQGIATVESGDRKIRPTVPPTSLHLTRSFIPHSSREVRGTNRRRRWVTNHRKRRVRHEGHEEGTPETDEWRQWLTSIRFTLLTILHPYPSHPHVTHSSLVHAVRIGGRMTTRWTAKERGEWGMWKGWERSQPRQVGNSQTAAEGP